MGREDEPPSVQAVIISGAASDPGMRDVQASPVGIEYRSRQHRLDYNERRPRDALGDRTLDQRMVNLVHPFALAILGGLHAPALLKA